MSARRGVAMRLGALTRKEFLQIARDPSSLAIAFFMPLFLLLLFGYGVSLDADQVPIALVADAPSSDSAEFFAALSGTHYFVPRRLASMAAAEHALLAGEVRGIVRLRADFARASRTSAGAVAQLVVNGVDANTARLVQGYVESAWGNWLAARAARAGAPLAIPVDVAPRIWFNGELRSRNYLVPGLVAIIMTLIGTLLTALVLAREWERGTMEALLVTPVSMSEILLGKLFAYFVLGTGGMLLTTAVAVWWFEVPLRGSFWLLWACASLFLLAALGMGLTISTLARSQFVAGQVALIATFLPAFLLSGFMFDIGSMPVVVRELTRLVVARYFVSIVQTLFLAGNVWAVIVPNALALLAMAALFLGITWRNSRKRLE